jgi:4a-hydroxytetrahydrobiopterin dehydratase
VGELAEEQNHHSDVDFGWVRACLTTFTRKMDGLTESDFVFAAKVNRL